MYTLLFIYLLFTRKLDCESHFVNPREQYLINIYKLVRKERVTRSVYSTFLTYKHIF